MKQRITEEYTTRQEWAERGGLVEQHEELADESVRRNAEEQQRLADLKSGEMYDYDKADRAWRVDHPAIPTEQILKEMRDYIKNAVEQREKGRI